MWLIKQFLGVKTKVRNNLIEIQGIGFRGDYWNKLLHDSQSKYLLTKGRYELGYMQWGMRMLFQEYK